MINIGTFSQGNISNIVYTIIRPIEPTTEPTSTSTESTTTRITLSLVNVHFEKLIQYELFLI